MNYTRLFLLSVGLTLAGLVALFVFVHPAPQNVPTILDMP